MADIKFSKRFLIKKGFKINNVDDILRLTGGEEAGLHPLRSLIFITEIRMPTESTI